MLLHDLSIRNANRIPNDVAFIFHDKRYNYKEVDEISDKLAFGLLRIGVKQGDHVALLIGNKPETILCAFACWKIGAAILPMNYFYTDKELNYILNNSEATTIIASSSFLKYDYVERLPEITAECVNLINKVVISETTPKGCINFDDLLKIEASVDLNNRLTEIKAKADDEGLAFLIYTGGTTGLPKGVLVTHEARYEVDRSWSDVLNLKADDRFLVAGPLFHLLPWHFIIASYILGATFVLMEGFDPEGVLTTIEKEKITFLPGVPTMFFYLADFPDLKKYNLSSLRVGITGGAVFPETRFREVEEKLGEIKLLNYYGLTEAGGDVTTVKPWDKSDYAKATIGRAIPGFDIRLVDKKRKEVAIGDEGEIAVKARWIKGYFKNPEEMKKAMDDRGWFYTGDTAIINKNGYIYYKGREKDMYICGGNNIYPAEIEVVLQKHPKISEAVILPIPHKTLGEVGRAYIIPVKSKELNKNELITFCKDNMASIKVPDEFVLVNELPLTPVGKVNKKPLKQAIEKEFSNKN